MATEPLFSIVTPIYNVALTILAETIHSVTAQAFEDWELILVDDNSEGSDIRDYLLQAQRLDPRIVVIFRSSHGGVSRASNDALAAASGVFLVLLNHHDLLAHGALAKVAAVLESNPDVDYLYSDEDKIDIFGNHSQTFAKPDWSPERLQSQMYCAHLSVIRLELARDVNGFNPEFDGSEDHDFVLRVTERARKVHHLAEVLYHWRLIPESGALSGQANPNAWDAGLEAVRAHVKRVAIDATVERGEWFGTYAVNRRLSPQTRVSVIIPTCGTVGVVGGVERVFVVEAVRSVLAKTTHAALEFVVVADATTSDPVLAEIRALVGEQLVVVTYDKSFNFSEKCNLGFLSSSGDIVVMLNDDVEVDSENFIEELCGPLAEESVGMTGAYLLYEDDTVQHAGHSYTERGYKHVYRGLARDDPGPFAALAVDREVSGLTAACIAIRREVFAEVGGFSERFPVNFNDVDLSMKLRGAHYRLLWLHRVSLYHFESQSRVAEVHPWEVDRLRARWGTQERDAYSEPAPSENIRDD